MIVRFYSIQTVGSGTHSGDAEGFGVFICTDDRSGYRLLKASLFEDAEEGEGTEFFYSEAGQKVVIE